MDALPGFEFTAVNPVSNWWFNIVSSLILGFVAGFVIVYRLVEPRLRRQEVPVDEVAVEDPEGAADSAEQMRAALTPKENKGLLVAVISGVALNGTDPGGRAPGGLPRGGTRTPSFLPKSPLLDSIVFIVVAYFMVVGTAYGVIVGTLRSTRDAVAMMSDALKENAAVHRAGVHPGQLHLAVQLIRHRHLDRSHRRRGPRERGPDRLRRDPRLHLLASVLNLFIISGSGMWAIMGAVFGADVRDHRLRAAFTQAAFRVGDSASSRSSPR